MVTKDTKNEVKEKTSVSLESKDSKHAQDVKSSSQKDAILTHESKVEKLRKVYLVDFCIKDLMLNKVIETNLKERISKDDDRAVLFNGKKPILEGMGNLFPKVEEFIASAKDNDEKTMKLTAIDAYGLRNKEMVRVVPMNAFRENKINPFVGLAFEADGMYGVVKSVSGGRVLVDFNSPYADHDVEVYIKKIKTLNEKEAIETILNNFFAKTNAKLKSFENEKIVIELTAQNNATNDMYKQVLDGFLKNFVKYKELVIENAK